MFDFASFGITVQGDVDFIASFDCFFMGDAATGITIHVPDVDPHDPSLATDGLWWSTSVTVQVPEEVLSFSLASVDGESDGGGLG